MLSREGVAYSHQPYFTEGRMDFSRGPVRSNLNKVGVCSRMFKETFKHLLFSRNRGSGLSVRPLDPPMKTDLCCHV